ncbi:MAG: PspC domain-containing protein [Melioribacteraceae bacterium]|nr:PspC domain-containing protein [Melioribacteraceae bacterium]
MKDRLFRSQDSRVIAGIAGGLGEYLNIDPVLIRILFVLVSFFNGLGALLYIILWIVIPENELKNPGEPHYQPHDDSENSQNNGGASSKKKSSSRIIFGTILIGIGCLFLFDKFFYYIDFFDILPFVLIIVGLGLLFTSFKNKKRIDPIIED